MMTLCSAFTETFSLSWIWRCLYARLYEYNSETAVLGVVSLVLHMEGKEHRNRSVISLTRILNSFGACTRLST